MVHGLRNATPDLLIVGGGLSGALMALAMARWQPDVRVELLEDGPTFGGNHVWSYFDSDVSADGAGLLAPMVAQRWSGYDIAFPARQRTITSGYSSLTSERLDQTVRATLGDHAMSSQAVAAVGPGHVTMTDGSDRHAGAVLDARGLAPGTQPFSCGWQKFVGQMLRLDAPHGLDRPVVMDATVAQIDGFRFVYVLPFAADRLFVEDTYYSDSPSLDRDAIVARIAAYADGHGWRVLAVEGEEQGVLPVVKDGDFADLWPSGDGIARAGARAGLFHPTTGYSLLHSVDMAVALAKAWPVGDLGDWTRNYARRVWREGAFFRMLDRMLFDAADPDQRYRVLQHFYRLPAPVVERFYGGRANLADRARILSGRPPVSIARALRAILRRS